MLVDIYIFSDTKIVQRTHKRVRRRGETTNLGGEVTFGGGRNSLPEPRLELRRACLADNDALGSGYGEVHGKSAAKPHQDVLDSLAGDDELAISPKKIVARKLRIKPFECTVYGIALAIDGGECNLLVGGVEECNILLANGDNLVLDARKDGFCARLLDHLTHSV